ncbi:TPA: hypothetical protein DCG61_02245 [Patescibacteria group bacterium]|jgi:hypothetical protein|nr:hypothetical protein [Patescibacteria group bacterium]
MDIIAHGVYNIALQRTIKKDKKTRKEILTAFWWGIMPDLLAFGIPFISAIFVGSLNHHQNIGGFDLASTVYPYTHSLVIFSLVFLAIYAVRRKWYLPMLGWGFHVLLDIPFHTPEFYPTPFLFPLSSYTLPFGISWGTPVVWIAIWVVVLLWLGILYKQRNNKSL